MAGPTTQQQSPSRPRQTAFLPIGNVHPTDVAAAAGRFDDWLREISGGLVNLERLKNVAGGLPVVGNIIALVSVAMDIRELYEKKSADVLDYVDIGVDLIGVVPIPPSLAAMRMSLRPMLGMVRGELVAQG